MSLGRLECWVSVSIFAAPMFCAGSQSTGPGYWRFPLLSATIQPPCGPADWLVIDSGGRGLIRGLGGPAGVRTDTAQRRD